MSNIRNAVQKVFRQPIKTLALLMLPTLLVACAAANPEAPKSVNFSPSKQMQINAAANWAVIADDMASQLKQFVVAKKIQYKPVYINLYSSPSTFTDNFNDLLTEKLIQQGVRVSKTMANSTIYNYKVASVNYRSKRTTNFDEHFQFTPLATGLLVARAVFKNIGVKEDYDIAVGAIGLDILNSDTSPISELLISSSVLSNNVYLYKTTDIYYLNSVDTHLYKAKSNIKTNAFDDPFYQ